MSELRDRLDELLDRVEAGETVTVRRDGVVVAELRPVAEGPRMSLEELLAWRRQFPPTDLDEFLRDMEEYYSGLS